MTVCARPGCPNLLAPNKAPGRARKWCSKRCRQSQYAGVCVDCGTPTSGSEGRRAEPRCHPCAAAAAIASGTRADMVRAQAKRERIQELWAAGATLNEIALDLRTTRATIGVTMVQMRKQGWDLPYRRTPR